jgi:hypothetical protein
MPRPVGGEASLSPLPLCRAPPRQARIRQARRKLKPRTRSLQRNRNGFAVVEQLGSFERTVTDGSVITTARCGELRPAWVRVLYVSPPKIARGEREKEGCPLVEYAFDPYPAAVTFDDSMH